MSTAPGPRAVQAAAGGDHTVIRDEHGDVWVAGSNRSGQLGAFDNANRDRFERAVLPAPATWVAAGSTLTAVVVEGGGLWVSGEHGNFGFSQVPTPAPVSVVAVGDDHIVVQAAGDVWVTGENGFGQLGVGNFDVVDGFVFVGSAMAGAVCAPNGTALLDTSGEMRFAGDSMWGILGRTRPQFSSAGGPKATHVACHDMHAAMIGVDGRLWVVGDPSGTLQAPGLWCVTPLPAPVVAVSCGPHIVAAVDADAGLWVAGADPDGVFAALVPGGITAEFQRVEGVAAADVSCGASHIAVIDTSGAVWAAGEAGYGQLGCGFYDAATLTAVELGTRRAELAAELCGVGGPAEAYRMADAAL